MNGEARSQPVKSTPHGPDGHAGGTQAHAAASTAPSGALVYLDPLLQETISGLDIECLEHFGIGHPRHPRPHVHPVSGHLLVEEAPHAGSVRKAEKLQQLPVGRFSLKCDEVLQRHRQHLLNRHLSERAMRTAHPTLPPGDRRLRRGWPPWLRHDRCGGVPAVAHHVHEESIGCYLEDPVGVNGVRR